MLYIHVSADGEDSFSMGLSNIKDKWSRDNADSHYVMGGCDDGLGRTMKWVADLCRVLTLAGVHHSLVFHGFDQFDN